MTMADTVAVMNKGRIEQMGAPELLYELPSTVFVANFLGQSNLFVGPVVESSGDTLGVEVAGRRMQVPRSRAQRTSGTVTVGVRPEKLTLHRAEGEIPAGANRLGPGRVIDVSFSGVSTQYLVDVPGLGSVIVFAQNLASGPVAGFGDEVWVSWDASHTFVLADEPPADGRFADDTDTQAVAAQAKERLLSELEEA